MRNLEPELGGAACREVTAAVVGQTVHEKTEWTLQEAWFEDSEDCGHLADPKRRDLK